MTCVADMALVIVLAITSPGAPISVGWSAPTTCKGGAAIAAPITYNVYRAHNGNPYTLTPHVKVKALKVEITAGIQLGIPDCFKVTATVGAGAESAFSVDSCVTQ